MKRKTVINGPCYKNELLIYQKETLNKIEGFRSARTKWLAITDDSQEASKKDKEGMKKSNIYKGRCSCLRKMRLTTTLLRFHYKNFRPESYWTFKKKLTDQEIEEYEEMVQRRLNEQAEPKRQLSRTVCSSSEVWKNENLEECMRDAAKMKGRAARKQKKKECKEKEISGPCKKAIRRLKAAKIKDGLIESCKCEDGREVTVVIKGICLCDKTSLNKVNLNKVCDEYSKMIKPPVTPQMPPGGEAPRDAKKEAKETNTSNTNQETKDDSDSKTGNLHVVDSAEIYRRKSLREMEGKRRNDKDTVDEVNTDATDERRKLTFENEENLKGDGEGRRVTMGSDVTLFRKFSSEFLNKSDVKPKTTPPTSHYLTQESPLNHDWVLGVSKAAELPQTESLNNLLVNGETKAITKNHYKKYSSPDKSLLKEHLSPWESVHLSNSVEIYKKHWHKNPHKKEEPAKTEQTHSKADPAGNRKHDKTTEKKTKVRLNSEPTFISPRNFPAEKTTSVHPETKPPATSLETHDVVTLPRSWSENMEKQVVESKSKASLSSRQTAETKPNIDDTSIVTLFKNEPEPKSEMGLTKEEHERMKAVRREEPKKKENNNEKTDIEKSSVTSPTL